MATITEPKKGKTANNGTKIIKCTCEHKSQDEIYGKNMRLHNGNMKGYKCTICGNIPNNYTC